MASYKFYNLTRYPIFVVYLGEEGICPIFLSVKLINNVNEHITKTQSMMSCN